MKTDFAECKARFLNNATNIAHYGVDGEPRLSFRGCQEFCGDGVDYYSWQRSSSTITTWILPILGVILQAPFESNAFWRTVFAITRWAGSPIASLMYILWNIKASGKCALMVDMSVPIGFDISSKNSDFGSIRDAFYILTVMNQYTLHERIRSRREAILLLKIALFSEDAVIYKPGGCASLKRMRSQLAQKIREHRRRGATPVFIANVWFLFAMGLSIQQAFGYLGDNATAHDLALGCLMAWLPVLILCSIVDRNPVATEAVRRKLNKYLGAVCKSLGDEESRKQFMGLLEGHAGEKDAIQLLKSTVSEFTVFDEEFFTSFAGQARVRWFRGCAHWVISTIENDFIAEHGRAWLLKPDSRAKIILASKYDSPFLIMYQEFWQAARALLIVMGAYLGAFIISYYTPMVGLGCRSGGYTVYGSISAGVFLLELLVWLATLSKGSYYQHSKHKSGSYSPTCDIFGKETTANRSGNYDTEASNSAARAHRIKKIRHYADRYLFRPIEVINTGWLLYIIMAQTFGAYNNCSCWTSTLGRRNGHMNFEAVTGKDDPTTRFYWILGTSISCTTMGLAMTYVVKEWCLQSHLSTENYESACKGIQSTRRWRTLTLPATFTRDLAEQLLFQMVSSASKRFGRPRRSRWILSWTPKTKVSTAVIYEGAGRHSPNKQANTFKIAVSSSYSVASDMT